MRYYLAVLIALLSSPVFSFEARVKCNVTNHVEWYLEAGEYNPKGFINKPVKDAKILRLTIYEQFMSTVFGEGFAKTWKIEAVDTFGPFSTRGKPEVRSVRYGDLNNDVNFFSKLIFTDPMCKNSYKSTLTHAFSSDDSNAHIMYQCECLSDYELNKFISN